MSSTFLNISTDNTLGGNGASDSLIPSQKAIKTYVDVQIGEGSGDTNIPYGESTSAADAVQKEVTISSIKELKAGQIIIVKPTITSTVADATLKLNNFTAYPMLYGTAAITTSTDSITWAANYPSWFRFDGSNWVFLGHGVDNNTTYSTMSVSEGTTGTKTTARSVRADYLKQIIQGTTLTGLSTSTNSAVTASDTVTTGIGKLQAEVNNAVMKSATAQQTIALSSGTGTTALGVTSKSSSSYISFSGTAGWIGSYGVSSDKKPVFYNGSSYTLAYTSDIPTNNNQLTNGAGYITGISSSDVTTALGYTPYNSTNPNGYQANVIETIKVNNTALTPSSKAVNITVPTTTSSVTSGSTAALTSGGAYTALQSYQTTANLVTSVSSSSTDSQYPSAKLFYDTCGDIESAINTIRGV